MGNQQFNLKEVIFAINKKTKKALDHLRKLRKSMDDTSNYEEITKRYLEAQKKAFLFRNKHFQVLENVIKQFEKENLVLEEKIKSQKMKRPSTQKKDLRKEKDELSAKIKNLKKDIEKQKIELERLGERKSEIGEETEKFKKHVSKNVPTSINKLSLYDRVAEIKVKESEKENRNEKEVILIKSKNKRKINFNN